MAANAPPPVERPEYATEVPRGATISMVYVGRQVKSYAVFDNEVESLSEFNAQATVYFSVASALVAYAVGIWTNAAFADKMTPEGAILTWVGGPILIFLATITYILGFRALKKRRKVLDTIRTESASQPAPQSPQATRHGQPAQTP